MESHHTGVDGRGTAAPRSAMAKESESAGLTGLFYIRLDFYCCTDSLGEYVAWGIACLREFVAWGIACLRECVA